jgi:hypothetical protein
MSDEPSVKEMLVLLEARIEHHRERKAFHGEREAYHRGQHTLHDAELEKVVQRYEALKGAAEAASEYSRPPEPEAPADAVEEPEAEIPRFGKRPRLSYLIGRVVDRQVEGKEFGARAIAAEVNRRYAEHLDRPVKPSAVSTVLRRLVKSRRIHEARPGKAGREAIYVRGTPRAARETGRVY